MRTYKFRYQHGQSMPYKSLGADNDTDFWGNKLLVWEKESGFKHVTNTVVCTISETYKVAESRITKGVFPPDTQEFRDKFFARTDDPTKPLTLLQERMQSGGPGERIS